MIGTGRAHVHTVVSIAQAQCMDGPTVPAVQAFANINVTFLNFISYKIFQSFPEASNSVQPIEMTIPVLLPHELIDAVARAGSLQAV